uniref:Aminotransferase-like plant mobile domain-containing protein n=1 Tax=Nicotiana tabacum TaxID=4097 RepID=A0A1S4BW15_TOBAC
MIERCRPETHTFHLPINEATITLEDAKVLFGLPVDGMDVSYPHALIHYTGDDYLNMLQRFTGLQPAKLTVLSGASRLQLMPIRKYLVLLHAEITDYSPLEAIDRQTWLSLLMMFGGILFPNTSGNL